MSKKTFNINSSLYPTSFLEDSREAFSDFSIDIAPDSVTIDDENPQYVFDEFMNYTLALSLEK